MMNCEIDDDWKYRRTVQIDVFRIFHLIRPVLPLVISQNRSFDCCLGVVCPWALQWVVLPPRSIFIMFFLAFFHKFVSDISDIESNLYVCCLVCLSVCLNDKATIDTRCFVAKLTRISTMQNCLHSCVRSFLNDPTCWRRWYWLRQCVECDVSVCVHIHYQLATKMMILD